jgi:hypothetical protein
MSRCARTWCPSNCKGHSWVTGGSWPVITPCFQVTAVDDTGAEHEGKPWSVGAWHTYEGSGAFSFWPPQARRHDSSA